MTMVETAEFTIAQTAPGENSKGMKTVRVRANRKKEWEGMIRAELLRLRLPRPIPMTGPLHVFITVRYGSGRGHETPNWEPFITKVVLDALRGGHPHYGGGVTQDEHVAEHGPGWIEDDKDRHVQPHFAISRLKAAPVGTTVRLLWVPATEAVEKESEPPAVEEDSARLPSTPEHYPGAGPLERKLSNRLYFRRHGVWPAEVFQERIERAGGSVDDEFAKDAAEMSRLLVRDLKREMKR